MHELLTKAEESGDDHIVSWLPGGKAFKVHKKVEFTNTILPTLFNATKYKSFQRNLNLWGFDTITEGMKYVYASVQYLLGSTMLLHLFSDPQSFNLLSYTDCLSHFSFFVIILLLLRST